MTDPATNCFSLCDVQATPTAKKVATFLELTSSHHQVLYGHQNDLHRKAGNRGFGFSTSDTYDVTGRYAAVNGIDALSLTGTEYGKWYWPQKKRVRAVANLAMRSMRYGSIVSFSAHMPNFEWIDQCLAEHMSKEGEAKCTQWLSTIQPAQRKKTNLWKTRPAILKDGSSNFSGYTPNDLRGSVVADVLPGGKLHSLFTAYLDMVCDCCLMLQKKKRAVIWRPFHENTGGWFWWGCNSCTPTQFKTVWQYTWNYFVNERGVHNLIWAYSPGSEPKTMEQFEERYPGDAYVDLIGFDMYQQYPSQKETFFSEYEKQMKLVAEFGSAHHKLWANTETGIAHPDNKALLVTGNEDFDWYTKILSVNAEYGSCYFLLWANFSKRGAFYAPYVTEKKGWGRNRKLVGHELIGSFLRLFNDERSIFSGEAGLDLLWQK